MKHKDSLIEVKLWLVLAFTYGTSFCLFGIDHKPYDGKGKGALMKVAHVSGFKNTLAQAVSYYYSESAFFLSFCSHRSSLPSIAKAQQLAHLYISNATIWISQALVWQEWQCLHRGSSAAAVNLICSYYHQVSLCRSHPAGLHQLGHSIHFSLPLFFTY